MISGLPDQSVDVFYIDADHSYEGVRRDLEALRPKVKPDGWIVMNDYTPAEIGLSNEPYGIIQATNEFMLTHGWEMAYFALAYVMYCDVGLRRTGVSWALPNGEIGHLQKVIASMRQSTSWRITAPLRSIGRLLKRAGE